MKQIEQQIEAFLQSRATVLLMLIAGVLILLSGIGLQPETAGSAGDSVIKGFGPIAAASKVSAILYALLGGVIAIGIMSLTNRTFDIMQSTSNLYVGLFVLLCASMPGALGMSMEGVILMVTLLFCLMFMYTTYGRPTSTRRIYLVFTLLSFGATFQYAFSFYIPMMLIGCSQMRNFSLRSTLAMIFGLITPFWILGGFGLISLDQFQLPRIGWPTLTNIAEFSAPELLGAGGMILLAIVSTSYNVVRVFGQNAQTRARNGLLALTTLWTIFLIIIDLGHLNVYTPLLAALSAINLTLYTHLARQQRAYILVLLAILLSLTTFAWNATL